MTHAASSHQPVGQAPFPPAEIEQLHAQDQVAARNIVVLMLGIFVSGLIGYLLVCYWVA